MDIYINIHQNLKRDRNREEQRGTHAWEARWEKAVDGGARGVYRRLVGVATE